ncbi:MAG TPA: hypothetical protein VK462_06940 [Nitrososphaeraceae archaeon]|nr:hypothetical protein [Nitrososphaeraceae archaeon]
MEKEFVLSDEERDLAIKMGINPDLPEFIYFKKEFAERLHNTELKICKKSGLEYEYVVQ